MNVKITHPNVSSDQLELMLKTNFMEALKGSSLRSFSFSEAAKVILVTVDGVLAALLIYRTVEAGLLAEVDFLATAAAFRRKGLSTKLIEELSADYAEIWLELSASNQTALRFYEKNRFLVHGRRADYYGPGVDALNMTKTREA